MPERMSMMVARITPHCLKQKGMAKILTPMMELASVMVDVIVMVVPKEGG
jgi:hypothetical protein